MYTSKMKAYLFIHSTFGAMSTKTILGTHFGFGVLVENGSMI